ncbi:hypothetical protein EOE18_09450 [Novosphingobium umbonatum]|uniref:EthD domain-containing protein n=1 Tax=Novosphingobium umbonatum TaxID=1908524 RepID=A0A3S2V6L0_9SPHN|nr:EthD domain-containing protein [Novosphingobium umbonatum]RVU04959.1 hypothetical protein EOE18_09450 [Novosphingobium umbonatum]
MSITLITLLKRREGMSKDEFIDYYETRHARIGEQVLAGYATRYERRFLIPTDGTDSIHDPDVVMEIDFPDQATMDACFAALSAPDILAMIVADEEQLFDRSRNRTFTVDRRSSKL